MCYGHWQIHPESAVPCRLTTNVESEECKKILEFQSTRNNVDLHGASIFARMSFSQSFWFLLGFFSFFSFFSPPLRGTWIGPGGDVEPGSKAVRVNGSTGQRVNGSAHGTDCLNMF